jgi:cobalt-zinc-cadmium efflux system protein
MGAGHSHGHAESGNERRLWIVLGLTSAFLVAEVIAALITKSLALLSDAAHMFTDVAALAIALVAIRIGKRRADRKRTFGYQRLEILAAAYNASVLLIVAVYIVYEAVQRLTDPIPIPTGAMFVVAVLGLIVNLLGMSLLKGGSKDNLNMKGAYLEVWSDMLGSVGVLIAAALIHFTGRAWIDSVVAVAIGIWVVPRTWTLLKESVHILMQGAPPNIDMDALENSLSALPGVAAIHDLHVWSMTSGKDVLSLHVVMDGSKRAEQELLADIETLVRGVGIHHSTVQIEADDCHEDEAHHH